MNNKCTCNLIFDFQMSDEKDKNEAHERKEKQNVSISKKKCSFDSSEFG